MSFTNRLRLECAVLPPMSRQIADHLLLTGNISGVEANAMYKCRSLTRRMTDIRDAGVNVVSEFKKDVTGQRYVRYVLQ